MTQTLWEAAARVVLCADEARRARNFTIPQLRDEYGEFWPAEVATVTKNLDNAVEILRAAVGASNRQEGGA